MYIIHLINQTSEILILILILNYKIDIISTTKRFNSFFNFLIDIIAYKI